MALRSVATASGLPRASTKPPSTQYVYTSEANFGERPRRMARLHAGRSSCSLQALAAASAAGESGAAAVAAGLANKVRTAQRRIFAIRIHNHSSGRSGSISATVPYKVLVGATGG